MVYLTTSSKERDKRLGEPIWKYEENEAVTVKCFTNCDELELLINCKSQGVKKLADFDDYIIKWNVTYEAGKIEAVCKDAKFELITFDEAKKLVIKEDDTNYQFSQDEIYHIEVNALGENGHLVYDANHQIICDISNNGKILGIENGDAYNHEDYQSNTRKLYHGKCLIYVKRISEGDFTMNVSSTDFDKATIII